MWATITVPFCPTFDLAIVHCSIMENGSNASCSWYQSAANTAEFISYDILMPWFTAAGLFGHLVSLIAFYHKSKKESVYLYQLFLSVNETLGTFTYVLYMAFCSFPDLDGQPGVTWYLSSYICMWIGAHVITTLGNIVVTLSMLLGISMASDRVFALGKPALYKNINHKKRQLIALIVCAVIAVISSVYDSLAFYPVLTDDGIYTIVVDESFVGTFVGKFLFYLASTVRGVAAPTLAAINIAMIVLYRRYAKAGRMISGGVEETKRKEQQKILALLASFESFFTLCQVILYIVYFSFLVEGFYACKGSFFTPIGDALIQIFSVCDFYVMFAISKSFRRMIFESVPCLKRFSATVSPVMPGALPIRDVGQRA